MSGGRRISNYIGSWRKIYGVNEQREKFFLPNSMHRNVRSLPDDLGAASYLCIPSVSFVRFLMKLNLQFKN